jgi:DNA-binding transcriptional ArsR family regulator
VGSDLRETQFVLSTLANPLRQRILAVLLEAGKPLSFTEVAQRIGAAEDSSVSFHLRRLTGPGLVDNFLERTPGGIRSIYLITAKGREWMERLTLSDPQSLQGLLSA